MTPLLRSFYAAFALAATAASLADKPRAAGDSGEVGRPLPQRRHNVAAPPPHEYRVIEAADEASELLDVVLVASVDGKFHALNRATGQTLWSMRGPALPALEPLVRTDHREGEQYIIEPQSGDIYVLAEPDGPLQRLPFSMPKLVDMSPFRFSDGGVDRVFVGKKETSLLVVELETGRLLRTINSECPWEPPADHSGIKEIDLDELEDFETMPPTSTHIYIGRSDYHVSIHTSPPPGSSIRPPVQNLSFSVYGPNNEDMALQSLYKQTSDDAYIMPLPDGQIMSVTTQTDNKHAQDRLRWRHKFDQPIVAVLDVLKAPARTQPFVLLQPHPRLEDVLGAKELASAARNGRLPNLERAFVGLTPRGALFALAPARYPLVVFSDSGRVYQPSLDGLGRDDAPLTVDEMARRRAWNKLCADGANMDPRCLVGPKDLGASGSGLSRLLIDAATPLPSSEPHRETELPPGPTHSFGTARDWPVNTTPSKKFPQIEGRKLVRTVGDGTVIGIPGLEVQSVVAMTIVSLGFLLALFWYKRAPFAAAATSSSIKVPHVAVAADPAITDETAVKAPIKAKFTDKVTHVQVTTAAAEDSDFVHVSADDGVPDTPAVPATPLTPGPDAGEDDSEGEEGAGPRRRRPRRRGKKKRGGAKEVAEDAGVEPVTTSSSDEKVPAKPPLMVPAPIVPSTAASSLVVSEEVLGFGSHGTVVYKGSLQGRAVAVKRLLQDFVTLASREVGILQDSDDHPNVIRYYYQEAQGNFLYIALELCPASLADIVERPDAHRELAVAFEPKRALKQITAGLRHLHALKIVHRDIKPQNILISAAARGAPGRHGGHRMLISDFGLCRRLEFDQTSFLPTAHGAGAAGTVGWRAPEILRGEVNVDEAPSGDDSASQSSRGSTSTVGGGGSCAAPRPTRLTKSVDIFALGCVFYYTLTNGGHPYGDRYEREVNILKDIKSLDALERFGEEGTEAVDLIDHMLDPEPSKRPDTNSIMLHPYFWDAGRRLHFLQDASDRFEIMCRDPRDAMLEQLETGAIAVVGHDWHQRLDRVFLDNLGKFRKYDGRSVQDLMRALRNKKHHYQDLPENVKRHVGAMPDGFLAYFTRRFPRLFLHVHGVIEDSLLAHESMFRGYFDPQE